MEALTAVSVAALTLYDMAKALEKSMQIEAIRLISKTGGKSEDYQREDWGVNLKTDTIFYRLFQEFPGIFFELIGQSDVDVSAYEFASVELKQTAFRIDGVFVPAGDSNLPV